MQDFETHPAGTAARIAGKTIADWTEFARRDDCLDYMVPSDLRQVISALTRANAATAAAFEVAAKVADRYAEYDYCAMNYPEDAGMAASSTSHEIRCEIRALATPDQTAALDKLIDEAVGPYADAMRYYETQFCEGFCEDMPDRSVTNEGMENDCSGCKARAILAASKKGGV